MKEEQHQNTASETGPTPPDLATSEKTDQPPPPSSQSVDPKLLGIVAYLTIIGWIIALVLNNPKNEHISYHIRQSLGIMLLFIASGIIIFIPILGWIVGTVGYIAGLVFWIIGLLTAAQGERRPVPVIGEKCQEWFQAL